MKRPWRFGPGNIEARGLTGQHGRWEVLGAAMSLGDGARYRCRCVDCGHELSARGTDVRRGRVGCPGCRERKAAAHA